MIFRRTPLPGVIVVEREPAQDERGSFARAWCVEEFANAGLEGRFVQSSISQNHRRNTVRGMHYQVAPSREAKLVQVVAGRVFDVVADLRAGSPSFGKIFTIELDARSGRALYIPPQCAHGFETLEDDTSIAYFMTQAYERRWERKVHWRSPSLAIPWPQVDGAIISDADREAPPFAQAADLVGGDGPSNRPG